MKGKRDMTNFERLKQLDSDEFVEQIQKTFDTPFKANIDWKAYMKGESPNVTDYIKTIGSCKVVPSEAEITAALGAFDVINESKRDLYIIQHTRIMPILDMSKPNRIYGNRMITVADIKNNRIIKVPEQYVEICK